MTESICLLHFADVHIGMESYGRTDPQTGVSSRVVDFLRCMDEMIAFAHNHEVDLAVFAGDAFKSRSPSPTFQREFAYRVQDLAEKCPVVLLVGNHDLPSIERRASSIEIYETLNVPNVTLGREYRVHQIETRKGPVVVATAPYPMRHHLLHDVDVSERRTVAEMDAALEAALVARLDALADEASQYDMPRILTGHFTVSGSAFGSERSVMLGRDVTVMLSVLDNPAWDYVALGHIHRHQCLTSNRPGSPPIIYSGSLERIDFGEESDPKGFVWADVARGRASWQFIEVNCRPFVTLRVDVRHSGDPTRKVLDEIARHDVRDAVVRLIITADPEADLLFQERDIYQALRAAGVNHVAAVTRQVERPARLRLGTSPEGLAPEQLLERYLDSREFPLERIEVLLGHARQIFNAEEL